MLKSHEEFYSVKGKRQILVADDEMINREMLREMLQDEYEVIFACDGAETMTMIESNQDPPSHGRLFRCR